MNCRIAEEKISLWLDGLLGAEELRSLEEHIEDCNVCALHAHQFGTLKTTLAVLPKAIPPKELNTALLVVASKARRDQMRCRDTASVLQHWRDKGQLWMSNLMRPLAVPVAGGVLTALLLFAMLAPMYGIRDLRLADVPTGPMLSTKAALKSSISFGLSDDDVVVDVLIDGEGRLLDYSIPVDLTPGISKELRKCIENTLLCTQFTPATMFGLPKVGKLRITLRRNQVDVAG
jgi:hypothetical protein